MTEQTKHCPPRFSPASPAVPALPARQNVSGLLTLREKCEGCGLDYSVRRRRRWPAIFVILLSGFIVVGAALIVEVKYQPPFWLHAVLWLPLILLVTLAPLRMIKGLLISLQYHHKAAEGRFEREDKA